MKKSTKIIVLGVILILVISGIFLYQNFNRLLSEALLRSFNSSVISDVYDLKFERLSVNPFEGSIRVSNVLIQPREVQRKKYPYINSSFRLKTEKLMLINVQLFALLKSSKLELESISILKPEIDLTLAGDEPILIPFKDSTRVETDENEGTKKKFIDSFNLREFQLVDADFHITDSTNQREFKIQKFTISLNDLRIHQLSGKDLTAFDHVDLSIGEFTGNMLNGPVSHVSVKDYTIKIDSLEVTKTIDTLIYTFDDLSAGLHDLDAQTADSLFHIALQSFQLSYKNHSIRLNGLMAKPNVSDAELQKKFRYQHAQFSGSVGSLELVNVNFDSLIYYKQLIVEEILLDSVTASIFKDKTKPIDKNRFPSYPGQTVQKISLPLLIKQVKVTNVNLVNVERKPDSSYAKVNIERATLEVKNITNRQPAANLLLNADAYINGKAHVNLSLNFSYLKPTFLFEGRVEQFNLPDLNGLTSAYTPATFISGTLDEISFSGWAQQAKASGTMKFLYHNMELDLKLKEQAKWKSAVIAFAANSVLDSSNPSSPDLPPRIAKFHIERDMNKGFINVIMKSILNGLKETMIMSKENRKAYQAAVKKKKDQGHK